jgi:hypothetical protein
MRKLKPRPPPGPPPLKRLPQRRSVYQFPYRRAPEAANSNQSDADCPDRDEAIFAGSIDLGRRSDAGNEWRSAERCYSRSDEGQREDGEYRNGGQSDAFGSDGSRQPVRLASQIKPDRRLGDHRGESRNVVAPLTQAVIAARR